MLISLNILWGLSEQFTEIQNNVEALPGETATMITELPKTGLDTVCLKDNVPVSITGEKYETANQDTAYELIVADVAVEDGGEYKVQGGEHESTISLTVKGQ